MHVHEPSTGEWRDLEIPLKELGLRKALSAVIFQGILFIVFSSGRLCRESQSKLCVLTSYNLETDTWREVAVNLPTREGRTVRSFHPRNLIVSGDQLFLMMWGFGESGSNGRLRTTFFAIIEILITSNICKVAVHVPTSYTLCRDPTTMHQIIPGLFMYIYGVPCVDSDGICSSVLWVIGDSELVVVCDLASGSMTYLTPHPLCGIDGREMREDNHPLGRYLRNKYRWKYMNLNWRKLLSRGRVTNALDATT